MDKDVYYKTIINKKGEVLVTGIYMKPIINIQAIFTIMYLNYTTAYAFEGESHDLWELVYIDNGEVTIESDSNTLVLQQSQFYLHAPCEFHKIRANNQLCNVIVISFDSDSSELFKLTKRVQTATLRQKQILNAIIEKGQPMIASNDFYISKKMTSISTIFEEQIVKNYIELFFLYCFQQDEYNEIKNTEYNHTIIQEIISFLKLNINDKITYQKISDHIGYSASYIIKIFKKTVGKSVFDYLYDLRIDKAKILIAANKFTFQKISEMLGFDSLQYFSTQFKKATNATPSQYAKSVKNTNLINPAILETIPIVKN